MRLPFRRNDDALPAQVRAAVDTGKGEQVLAFAIDDNFGGYVVATTFHLNVVLNGEIVRHRAWHEVDAGGWQPDTWTLSVTWVDGSRGSQWSFDGQTTRLPEVFRERVQASVVLSQSLGLQGPRRSGRVVVRRDLQTGRVFTHSILGRSTPAEDSEVQDAVDRVTSYLREQVGL